MRKAHRPGVAAAAMQITRRGDEEPERFNCIDGEMTSRDVARAAGISAKAAKRALNAYAEAHEGQPGDNTGVTLTFPGDAIPEPETVTKGALALIIAERLCLGRFAIKKRVEERAAEREERTRMTIERHPWNRGDHGRSIKSLQGGVVQATLDCSKCDATETIQFRQLCDPDAMDRKFAQKGWAVDPAKCPAHNRRNHQPRQQEKPTMNGTATFATPTPAAIAAQAKMFGLLQVQFDPESGTYANGYSDKQVAAECKLSVDMVAAVRDQAFGPLKVPGEVAQLTADIEALEALLTETVAPIQTELRALKSRVADCCRKFGG